MAKQLLAKCRHSASLIILAKQKLVPAQKFDYQALLFCRHQKTSFMPNATVFPGGVHESADESPLWLKYFQSIGMQLDKFNELLPGRHEQPAKQFETLFEHDNMRKNISMRITAIRETFEEVGILFCRKRDDICDTNGYGNYIEDFDRAHWQHLVHNDPKKFLTLCQELKIVPDLWNLHEWSTWITPSTFDKRFETAFYLTAIQDTPNVLLEENEVIDYAWQTPYDYIMDFLNKKLWLPPPQFYELSRLLNITNLDELKTFAQERARKHEVIPILPVDYKCDDGKVFLLPGDEKYPQDPNATNKSIITGVTREQFRAGIKKLHRSEYINSNKPVLHLNFSPNDGQLNPACVHKENDSAKL